MNDFDFSKTIARLIIDFVCLHYEPAVVDGDIRMIEKWELKYPN